MFAIMPYIPKGREGGRVQKCGETASTKTLQTPDDITLLVGQWGALLETNKRSVKKTL
jgi:hypothetical protein